MQPSGNLHIGNYLGALKNWVRIQSDYEGVFCIVDLHAVTLYQGPPTTSSRQDPRAGCALLAAGIGPETEQHHGAVLGGGARRAGWMLTCVTPVGWSSA